MDDFVQFSRPSDKFLVLEDKLGTRLCVHSILRFS